MSVKVRSDAEPAVDLTELIARSRRGDDDALEQLIRACQRRVAAFVVSLIGNDDDWQDVCQQVFVKMVLGLRRLDSPATFEPWLMKIARNASFDHLRRRRTRRFLTPWQDWHESVPEEPSSAAAEAQSASLETAISQLPPDQRELMTMVRSRHWSYQGLAEATGLTLAALKSRLFRARRRLRELMTADGSDDET
jgi:RNA polymerase sigma-70 factor (ECF subfamily)